MLLVSQMFKWYALWAPTDVLTKPHQISKAAMYNLHALIGELVTVVWDWDLSEQMQPMGFATICESRQNEYAQPIPRVQLRRTGWTHGCFLWLFFFFWFLINDLCEKREWKWTSSGWTVVHPTRSILDICIWECWEDTSMCYNPRPTNQPFPSN